MNLREFVKTHPKRKLILLWFDKNGEVQTDYNYPNQFTEKAMSMMDMEVMETQTFDEEDWIEVWLK